MDTCSAKAFQLLDANKQILECDESAAFLCSSRLVEDYASKLVHARSGFPDGEELMKSVRVYQAAVEMERLIPLTDKWIAPPVLPSIQAIKERKVSYMFALNTQHCVPAMLCSCYILAGFRIEERWWIVWMWMSLICGALEQLEFK